MSESKTPTTKKGTPKIRVQLVDHNTSISNPKMSGKQIRTVGESDHIKSMIKGGLLRRVKDTEN